MASRKVRRFRELVDRSVGFGFAERNNQEKYRDEGRGHSDPQHRFDVACEQDHEYNRQQWPDKGPDGIECLAQTIGCAPKWRWCNIGNDRVTGRAANAFSNAIDKAGPEYPSNGCCQWEYRFGQGAQCVPRYSEPFSFPVVITDRAGKHLRGRRDSLGNALDNPHRDH